MMPICCIFAGGPEEGLPCLPVPKDASILCADSGLLLARRLGLQPDCVMGDFDSLGFLPEEPHLVAPVEKDDTDTMLAVRYALAQGCKDIRIFGALGGRLDHTFANLQVLRFLDAQGAAGMLVGANDVAVLQGAEQRAYPRWEGFSLSVFSLTEQTTGVYLRGVQFPLTDATLTAAVPLGVSNCVTAASATVSCRAGLLLVMRSRLTQV